MPLGVGNYYRVLCINGKNVYHPINPACQSSIISRRSTCSLHTHSYRIVSYHIISCPLPPSSGCVSILRHAPQIEKEKVSKVSKICNMAGRGDRALAVSPPCLI